VGESVSKEVKLSGRNRLEWGTTKLDNALLFLNS